ncbi:hypothetical protein GOBAR_DD08090 [Gossypium barbadense]|nr:hypothetical protein GOBAR_DD08090 [Gossypium barbadense]
MGVVRFDDSSSAKNPLPNGVDVREGWGLVISNSGGGHGKTMNHCEFHHEKGYETQESVKFKALAPGTMDDKEMKLYSDFPLERGMCLDGSHDFGNDIDRSLSPDLVRRVEQEDR